MMTLKATISVKTCIVMIQESFIGSQKTCYSSHFYLLQREKKKIRVMTAVRKDLGDKIMIDQRINLIHHS